MIVRDVDVNNLNSFDFYNDTSDTAGWLRGQGRDSDANKLVLARKFYSLKDKILELNRVASFLNDEPLKNDERLKHAASMMTNNLSELMESAEIFYKLMETGE